MAAWVLPTLIAGLFVLSGSFVGAAYLVKNSNGKSLEEFKISVTSQIAQIKTLADNKTVCAEHQKSFSHAHGRVNEAHDRIDEVKDKFSEELKHLVAIITSLDKSVALLSQKVDQIGSKS